MRCDCGLQERNDWERNNATKNLRKKSSRCFAGRMPDQGYLHEVDTFDEWLLERKARPWWSFPTLRAIRLLPDFQWTLRSTVLPYKNYSICCLVPKLIPLTPKPGTPPLRLCDARSRNQVFAGPSRFSYFQSKAADPPLLPFSCLQEHCSSWVWLRPIQSTDQAHGQASFHMSAWGI